MIKIVHFGKYYLPDRGGIESVTQSISEGAIKVGNEVTAICFDKSNTGESHSKINGVVVERHTISKMVNNQPLGWSYFIRCVLLGRKAEIVHLHAPNLLASLASIFLGGNPKLIVHWHSDIINKGWLGRLVFPLEMLMLHRADAVIATSERYADASPRLTRCHDKVHVVPLGVRDLASGITKKVIPSRFKNFLKDRKFVLSLGRLSAYKGFSVLLDAAKYLPDDIAVIIAGDGELRKDLLKQCLNNNLVDKILFAGRVTDEELEALYQHAELFCLPSNERSEAFGVVLMEAMTFSLPIVATNIAGSGVPWVNSDYESGINVPINDPIALAKAIQKILENMGLRLSLAYGSRYRYEQNFRDDNANEKVMCLYESLASSSLKSEQQ